MYNIYIFEWYDSSSDNGWNKEYFITDNPKIHAKEIGHDCKYKEFKQEGFTIEVRKSRNINDRNSNGNWDNFKPGDMKG